MVNFKELKSAGSPEVGLAFIERLSEGKTQTLFAEWPVHCGLEWLHRIIQF